MAAEISRLSVNLPRRKHCKVKKAASSMGISIRELVELSLDEFLHRKPNKETEEALQESLSGKGLKKFKNAEDLFKHLKN
ncbi:MAG: hypothetical protein NTX49_08785 [Chlamydiae bacterium]|nr:hypothetical protein [Chlamydiota bacterium]